MKWGVSLAQAGELADPTTVADLAKQAEDAGWDGVFVWDHLWHRTGLPLADPWVTLAAIAAATQHVAIGTLVCALPRRRPQLVAQAATTLDRLSGARMVLGLGLGVDSYGEFSTFGEPAADDRGRGAALDAGIELLLPMLAGDPVPAAGGRVTTAPSARRPRLPVWVAGTLGHRAGPRRVARFALEGLSLVGAGEWTPEHVTAALDAGGLAPGAVDVVLTGGEYPDPPALAAPGSDLVRARAPSWHPGRRRPRPDRDAAPAPATAATSRA